MTANERVFRDHHERLLRRARARGRHDAEDLVSTVWVKFVDSRIVADPSRNIDGLLNAMLNSAISDVGRDHYRRPTIRLGEHDPQEAGDAPVSVQAERSEEANRLRSLLPLLTPDEREAVEAVYIENRTFSEAAAQLGIPIGTVKTRCHRAHRFLRVRLSEAA